MRLRNQRGKQEEMKNEDELSIDELRAMFQKKNVVHQFNLKFIFLRLWYGIQKSLAWKEIKHRVKHNFIWRRYQVYKWNYQHKKRMKGGWYG